LRKLVLDVRIDGHAGRLRDCPYCAKCLGEAWQESKVAWAFIFRPLLRLYIQVNPIESIRRMPVIELHDSWT